MIGELKELFVVKMKVRNVTKDIGSPRNVLKPEQVALVLRRPLLI